MNILHWRIPPLPQLVTAGHSIWQPGMQHFRRSFNIHDLVFVRSGCIYLAENEQHYEIGAGQMLMLEAGKTHEGYRPCDTDTELFWIHIKHDFVHTPITADHISWSLAPRIGTDSDLHPVNQSIYLPKYGSYPLEEIWRLLDNIVKLHNTMTTGMVWRLQLSFIELLMHLQQFVQAAGPSTSSGRLASAVAAFIRNHAGEGFHVGMLEREFHFHTDYLSRCLKRHTGMSTLEYVRQVRIEQACRLLTSEPECSIRQIAERVGIPDVNYFCRLFRKVIGVSPTAYRQTRFGYI